MAIDTRQKRQSSIPFLMPGLIPGVNPSGAIIGIIRQASIWVYSGIFSTIIFGGLIQCDVLFGVKQSNDAEF